MRQSRQVPWHVWLCALGLLLLSAYIATPPHPISAAPDPFDTRHARPLQAASDSATMRQLATETVAASQPASASRMAFMPLIVRAANPPRITSFSSSPASIGSGGVSTLHWSVIGATLVSISPGVGTVGGSSVTVQPARTTQYTLSATNSDGGVIARTTVTVTGGNVDNQGFLFLPGGSSDEPSIAIDPAGGLHAVYASFANGRRATYAYCAAGCARASNWTAITLGDIGLLGGYLRLDLDSEGRPRIMWYNNTGLSDGRYVYAACDQSCAGAANWTVLPLITTSSSPGYNSRYFALDAQGRPRFIYDNIGNNRTGTFLGFCNMTCLSLDNWYGSKIDDTYLFSDYSLAFDAAGRPRLALKDARGSQPMLVYFECDADCTNGDNWIGSGLYQLESGYAFRLRLDSYGRPRIALYAGSTGSGQLFYAWCNVGCKNGINWDRRSLGLPEAYGGAVDLALDSHDRPRLAYHATERAVKDRLGYSWCNVNCESAGSVWQIRVVETDDELDVRAPIPPAPGCSLSFWTEMGWHPSLALDPLDNPRMGYTAVHSQGGACPVHDDIRLVRLALFDQP